MKKQFTLCMVLSFFALWAKAQVEYVGSGQTYATLTEAITDINNGNLTGDVELIIMNSITNTAANTTLLPSGTGSGPSYYTSLKIYPGVANVTVTGRLTLSGNHITIDGRVNQTGTTNDLTITSSGNTLFLGECDRFVMRNVNVVGDDRVVHITGYYNTSYLGFRNSKFLQCLFHSTRTNNFPQFQVLLNSEPFLNGMTNHLDTIQQCNFRNWIGRTGTLFPATDFGKALRLAPSNYGWVIDGNSFYDDGYTVSNRNTTSRAIIVNPGTSATQKAHRITNNFIGGSAPQCGGSPLTLISTGSGQNSIYCIEVNGATDSVLVEQNTIANIAFVDNKCGAQLDVFHDHSFKGIHIKSGNAWVKNNLIGSTTVNGSINLTNIAEDNDMFYGILNQSTGKVTIEGNTLAGITTTQTLGTKKFSITGIQSSAASGYCIVKGNTIGSNLPLSIHAATANNTTQDVLGILALINDSALVEYNIVKNLHNASLSTTTGTCAGIDVECTVNNVARTIVRYNQVSAISSNSLAVGSYKPAAVGLFVDAINYPNNTMVNFVYGNTTDNIQATNTGVADLQAIGIKCTMHFFYSEFKSNFSKNTSTAATGANTQAIGMQVTAGNIYNNIIKMDASSRKVYGLACTSTSVAHNTIHLGNNNINFESACIWTNSVVRNNILSNINTNASGTTKRHFGVRCSVANVGSDYNNIYVPNLSAGAAIGKIDPAPYETILDFQTASNSNASSIEFDPVFIQAGGNLASDYFPTAATYGSTGLGITTDYFNHARLVNYWMGAIQAMPGASLPLQWISFDAVDHQSQVNLFWETAQEVNTTAFQIERSTDAKEFFALGTVSTKNKSTQTKYSFVDDEVEGLNELYYRIKQLDADGKYNYSAIQRIQRNNHAFLTLYPNPATMYLQIQLSEKEATTISIYSLSGTLMLQTTMQSSGKIDVQSLTPGQYVLRGFNKNRSFSTHFIKN